MIQAKEYIDFVVDEYLHDFIRQGGAAVKFAVPLDGTGAQDLVLPLRDAAVDSDYVFAAVEARRVRVHMIDQVFHEIARQVNWDELARSRVIAAFGELGFDVTSGRAELDLDAIARQFNHDPLELRRDFKQQLQQDVMRDYSMAREFRTAMLRLCQAQVDRSPAVQSTRDSIFAWLTGELRRISALKDALIFQKIARNNARHMLFSLARWVKKCGRPGLVLAFDISQLTVPRRDQAGGGQFYSRPNVMDAYEVLRQLVDGTDELESCFVLVVCAPGFLTDEKRSVQQYWALMMRIWDEVRDRRRTNPLAALIRISSTPESPGGQP